MKLIDLQGKKFGKLTAQERVPLKKRTKWKCQCDCGSSVEVYAQNLVTGNTTTCGCSGRGRKSKIDITGEKFGRLTVLSQYTGEEKTGGGGTNWNCLCDCGSQVVKNGYALRAGDIKTCGCGSHPLKYDDPSKAAFNELLAQYKKNAKKTGRAFSLTEDEFRKLTGSICHYCGRTPSQLGCYRTKSSTHTSTQPYLANGIDRIINTEGYTSRNSIPCCKLCNWMKSNLSYEDFISHLRRILAHLDAMTPPRESPRQPSRPCHGTP